MTRVTLRQTASSAEEHSASAAGDATGSKNMLQLIQLRWIAVFGQLLTIAVVHFGFGINLPLRQMALVLAVLVLLNVASQIWLRRRAEVSNANLFLVLTFDVAALTVQLYLSGGPTNPFISLYLLQVTLAAVLLDVRRAWVLAGITSACVLGLTLGYRPLELPSDLAGDLFRLHLQGLLICFMLVAALLVFFVTRINGNLRARDAHLARMRQQAAEADHIVRMGLLASGAAHELGTPLSTVSVILGDWRHMEAFRAMPELLQEIEEMQAAVGRCKAIVTGILLSAGEARGEAPVVTTAETFLRELVEDWRITRPSAQLTWESGLDSGLEIVADRALKQVLFNVLDNAYEGSGQPIRLSAFHAQESLVLEVSDNGPGFAPDMLAEFGKPYRSSKGRTGGGLGLFLVVNVVRKLGGSVSARNRPEGGATVTLTLPLAALAIDGDLMHVG
jgi:two-component system sensor histidine kinase RegB